MTVYFEGAAQCLTQSVIVKSVQRDGERTHSLLGEMPQWHSFGQKMTSSALEALRGSANRRAGAIGSVWCLREISNTIALDQEWTSAIRRLLPLEQNMSLFLEVG